MTGLLGASRADEVNNERNDGEDQQDVDEKCGDVEGYESRYPRN